MSFEELPPEMIQAIVAQTEPSRRGRLAQSSAYLNQLVNDPRLWRRVIEEAGIDPELLAHYPEITTERQLVSLIYRLRFYFLLQAGDLEAALKIIPRDLRPTLTMSILFDLLGPGEMLNRMLSRIMGWRESNPGISVIPWALYEAATLDYRPVYQLTNLPVSIFLNTVDELLGISRIAYRMGHPGFIETSFGASTNPESRWSAASWMLGHTGDPFFRQLLGKDIIEPNWFVTGALKAGAIDRALEFPGLENTRVVTTAFRVGALRYLKTITFPEPGNLPHVYYLTMLATSPFNPGIFNYFDRILGIGHGAKLFRQDVIDGRELITEDILDRTLALKMAIYYEDMQFIERIPGGEPYLYESVAYELANKKPLFVKRVVPILAGIVGYEFRTIERALLYYAAGKNPVLFRAIAARSAYLTDAPITIQEDTETREFIELRPNRSGTIDFTFELIRAMRYESWSDLDFILERLPYTVTQETLVTNLLYGPRALYPLLLDQFANE